MKTQISHIRLSTKMSISWVNSNSSGKSFELFFCTISPEFLLIAKQGNCVVTATEVPNIQDN